MMVIQSVGVHDSDIQATSIAEDGDALVRNHLSRLKETAQRPLGPPGKALLSGYVNRISPAIVMIQTISDISGGIGPDFMVNHVSLAEEFMDRSSRIKEVLVELESSEDIGRGEKLSDGFPSNSDLSENPKLIALRNLLGSNGTNITPGSGYLQEAGILVYAGDGNVHLSPESLGIEGIISSDLNGRLSSIETAASMQRISQGPPKHPVFIPEDDARKILEFIRISTPDEHSWEMGILASIVNAPGDSWDSNNLADEEVERCLEEQDFSYWNTRTGESRYEKYMDAAIRKGIGDQLGTTQVEQYAIDKLRGHINATLSGALGRMKELGLIHPVKMGRKKNFKATNLGGDVLGEARAI